MEEMIAILADFNLSEINHIKYSLHEESILILLEWKSRQAKRQALPYEDDQQRTDQHVWKTGENTEQELAMINSLFPSAG